MDDKVERVVRAGAERGLAIEPLIFPVETRTARDAAIAVGCDVAQIVKSLVFDAGDRPVLVLMSGINRVDLDKGAKAAGVDRLRRADADTARAATGYSIGATPPFGHEVELRVFMDEDLLDHDVVWAAAGRPDSVFPASPAELARVSGASVCDLKEER
jgi:prolyl-tRNA editing enzyme YbaK/EbsC (Cys-tRNA(Pro) deacylase)